MRINRFCEARGLYESDNSIESKIFCFGDDGPSGDSSSTAASEDIGTKDVDKGPRGQDTSSDREAYSDRFGGTSTRNFNIDRDQGFVDTDKGRVYGSTDVLSAGMASGDITPSGDQTTADFTAGVPGPEPSIADFDTTNVPEFDEPAGAVNLEDALGYDPFTPTAVTQTAKGPALGTTDYEFDAVGPRTETPDSVIGLEGPAVSTSRSPEEMALTGSPTFSFENIDIFDPTRPDLARDPSQPAVSIRAATPADQVLAQARGMTEADYARGLSQSLDQPFSVDVDAARAQQVAEDQALGMSQFGVGSLAQAAREVELETGVPASQVAGVIGLTGPAATTSRTPQEMALTGSQTFDVQPSVQGTFDPRISAGVMSDSPQQFDLEQMQLANDLIARSTAAANRTPVTLDRPLQKDAEGYFRDDEFQIADQGPSPTVGLEGAAVSTPRTAEEMALTGSQTFDAQITAPQPAATDKYTGEVVPGMGASIDRAIDDFVGQRIGRTQEMGPEGQVTTENFGLRGDLVSQPTPYLSGYSPTEQNLMEEGYLAERNVDIPFMPVASGIINTFFNPEYMVTDAIRKGASPIYSQDGTQIIGARSEDGSVVYSESPIGDIFSGFKGELDPNMQAAYDERRRIENEQRANTGGDGGEPPILPPIEETPAEAPPVDDQGRALVEPYQYQQRGPISYAYTGLPSLAPTRLRPSYQASKRFSPLFPVS